MISIDFEGFDPKSGPDLGRIWVGFGYVPHVKPSRNLQETFRKPRGSRLVLLDECWSNLGNVTESGLLATGPGSVQGACL